MSLVYPSNSAGCKNILLIDNNVPEANLFASSVNSYTFPIIYSPTSTKTELLVLLQTKFKSIERICLVFEYTLGTINTFLDDKPFFLIKKNSDSPYGENIDFIISVLKQFSVKNIDYLACDTLNNPEWVDYYTLLNKNTGVVVGHLMIKLAILNMAVIG